MCFREQQFRDPRLSHPYLLTSIYINFNIKQKSRQHTIEIERKWNPYMICRPKSSCSFDQHCCQHLSKWYEVQARYNLGQSVRWERSESYCFATKTKIALIKLVYLGYTYAISSSYLLQS